MTAGKKDDALAIFQLNAKLHPNAWPVNWGLARAYSAEGKYPDALKYAKLALPQAPDDVYAYGPEVEAKSSRAAHGAVGLGS